jgi:hypothetical protein
MSMEVIGGAGESLGQFASNAGYSDLIAAAKEMSRAESRKIRAFFRTGETSDVPAVMKELRALAKDSPTADVKETATGLALLLANEKAAIISNGMVLEDEPEPGELEKAWTAEASDEDRSAWELRKSNIILDRRHAALLKLSRETGTSFRKMARHLR